MFNCQECPTGADCDSYGSKFSTLEALPGFWRPTNVSENFYRCPLRELCQGGQAVSEAFDPLLSGSGCKAHRTGILCHACEPGWRSSGGTSCEPCPDDENQWILFLGVGVAVAFLMWIQLYIILRSGRDIFRQEIKKRSDKEPSNSNSSHSSSVADENDDPSMSSDDLLSSQEEDELNSSESWSSSTVDKKGQKPRKVPAGADAPDAWVAVPASIAKHSPPPAKPNFTYKLKIFLTFIQLSTMISSGLDIQWPSEYKKFLTYFEFANMDYLLSQVTSAECVDGMGYYSKFGIIVSSPILIFLLIFLFYLLPRELDLCCFKNQSIQARRRAKINFWRMFLYLLFLIYPTVSSTVLRHYVCREFDGFSYLWADLKEKCFTDRWTQFSYGGIALILMYPIGIPLFFFALLERNRRELHTATVKAKLGFLYAGYRPEAWWFELIDTSHKLIVTSILGFFPAEFQLPVGMSVVTLYLCTLLRQAPYLRTDDDRLHLIAQTEIFMLLSAGWVFYSKLGEIFNEADDLMMSLALIALTCLFFVIFIVIVAIVVVRAVQNWSANRRAWREKQLKLEKERATTRGSTLVLADEMESAKSKSSVREDSPSKSEDGHEGDDSEETEASSSDVSNMSESDFVQD